MNTTKAIYLSLHKKSSMNYCKTNADNWRIKNQLDAICYPIILLIGLTCFGHYYAHHQELTTVMLITTLVVSFCKDGGVSVNRLASELFFLILAHSVYKMWIKQEPNKLELWNKLHFEEKETENV